MDHLKPHPELYNIPFTTDDFNGMPYRTLGASGLRVSTVGLGTWKMGFPETGDGARVDEKTSMAILDRAVELGVTFWDTANRYNGASGNSERVIGRWFKRNGDQRRNVVLATKMCGALDGTTPNHGGLSRGCVLDSVYASLGRLQLDYIDLLYFHRPDNRVPIEESLSALVDLVARDLVRYFAVSNFTAEDLSAYREVEQRLGIRSRILAVQNQYDILFGERDSQSGVLDYCDRNGLSLVAWGPLRRGLLTDRYLDPAKAGPGDRLYDEGILDRETAPAVIARLEKLHALAQEWGMTLSQLALVYMLQLPGMGPVIPSASTVEQLESNAEAGKITLTEEQSNRVREAIAS